METSHSDRARHKGALDLEQPSLEPSTTGRLQFAGHALYCEKYGPEGGKTVALLHHGLGSTRSWQHQVPAFLECNWQVVFFDLWGYSCSDTQDSFAPEFLHQDAQETIMLLDALGVGNISLIGYSDGGTIAIMLAAEYPERIDSLVTVAAYIYYEPVMALALQGVLASAQSPPLQTALQREHGARAEALVKAWIGHWLHADTAALTVVDELPKIKCPVLVIQSELDEQTTPQHAKDIADGMQDGHLWLIPGVHHMPPHELPENFNRMVLGMLEEHTFPAGG